MLADERPGFRVKPRRCLGDARQQMRQHSAEVEGDVGIARGEIDSASNWRAPGGEKGLHRFPLGTTNDVLPARRKAVQRIAMRGLAK